MICGGVENETKEQTDGKCGASQFKSLQPPGNEDCISFMPVDVTRMKEEKSGF